MHRLFSKAARIVSNDAGTSAGVVPVEPVELIPRPSRRFAEANAKMLQWAQQQLRDGRITLADFLGLQARYGDVYQSLPASAAQVAAEAMFAKAATVQTSLNKPADREKVPTVEHAPRPWLYLRPDLETRRKLREWQEDICAAIDGAEPVQYLHVTLFHRLLDPSGDRDALKQAAADAWPCEATLGQVLAFRTETANAVVVEVRSPALERLRDKLSRWLKHEPSRHNFRPHVTIAYIPFDEGLTVEGLQPIGITGREFVMDAVILKHGSRRQRFPLLGAGPGYLNAFRTTDEVRADFEKALRQGLLFADEPETEPEPEPVGSTDNCGAGKKGSPGFQKDNDCARGGRQKIETIPGIADADEYKGPRRHQVHNFEKPIIGPSGATLTAYEWRFTGSFNEEGDEIKISDWDNAEQSAETGRQIVHVFEVVDTDQTLKTVSLESAMQLLGYLDPKRGGSKDSFLTLANALKKQAMLQMQLDNTTNPAKKVVLAEKLKAAQENVAKWERLAADPNNNPDARRDMVRQVQRRMDMLRTDAFGVYYPGRMNPGALVGIAYARSPDEAHRQAKEIRLLGYELNDIVKASHNGGITPDTLTADDLPGKPATDDAKIKRAYVKHGEKIPELLQKVDRWIELNHPVRAVERMLDEVAKENKPPAELWHRAKAGLRGYQDDSLSRLIHRVRMRQGMVWDDTAQKWTRFRPQSAMYAPADDDVKSSVVTKAAGLATTSGATGGFLQTPHRRHKRKERTWYDDLAAMMKALDAQYGTEEWPA